jgi:Uma2 family endonuclease
MVDYGVMANPAHQPIFTSSDYLAWEEEQTERHEFVAGELFLRDASEDRHVTVSGNLHAALHYHLRSSPCRIYAADMRLHIEKADAYFYPDVFVTCSKKDLESSKVKAEPIFIAEILSPSTAAYDRGLKFEHYRTIETLQEYAIIDPQRRHTDCYRKGADGLWVLHPFGLRETVVLRSVDLEIPFADLFAKVDGINPPKDSPFSAL